jgi:hypothetical protein
MIFFPALSSLPVNATWREPSRSTTITSCTDVGSGSYRTRMDDLVPDQDLVHAIDLALETTSDRLVETGLDPNLALSPGPSLDLVPSLGPDLSPVLDPSPDLVPNLLLEILLREVESDLDPILDQDPEHRKSTLRNRDIHDGLTMRPKQMEMIMEKTIVGTTINFCSTC